MDFGEKDGRDFYAVLGLKKECTPGDLRIAYKKLAMKWHPDRFSALGNSKYTEEAKKKFQVIQEAYSVLSNDGKRFLYDMGVYDNDDGNEMEDFMSEMADLLSQNKCTDKGNESLEDLQNLFVEMFQSDLETYGSSSNFENLFSCGESLNATHKRNSTEKNMGKSYGNAYTFDAHMEGFCLGMGETSRRWLDGEKKKNRTSRSRK